MLTDKYKDLFIKFRITTPLRKQHFMTQLDHESKFQAKRESLYYTKVAGAKANFKTPFENKSTQFITSYLCNSEKMANYVYANRMGNGDVASGDGFRYRSGGFIGITGKNAYREVGKALGIDLVNKPDLITQEEYALGSALWYWDKAKLNIYADKDDLDSISDIVNIGHKTLKKGDANGFESRAKLLAEYKRIIK